MTMGNAHLGALVNDHEITHEQVAQLKAELEQISEALILFGSNLKERPETMRVEQAKIVLKDQRHDRTVLRSHLDLASILQTVEEFRQAAQRERELVSELEAHDKRYIVDGLKNRRAPTPDILNQDEQPRIQSNFR